jgi:hypothetical protein
MIWTAVEIGWESTSGTTYQVQWCSNLTSNDWQNLGVPLVGTDGTNTVFDSTRGLQHRYYRVMEQ